MLDPGNDSVLSYGFAWGSEPESVHQVERRLPTIDALTGLDLQKNLHCGFANYTKKTFQALPAMTESMADPSEYAQSHTKSFQMGYPLDKLDLAAT